MKVDLTELTKHYSRLSEEEFSRIDPQDLTKDARACYDREAERRRTSEWQTEQRERDQKFDEQQLQFDSRRYEKMPAEQVRISVFAIFSAGLGVSALLSVGFRVTWDSGIMDSTALGVLIILHYCPVKSRIESAS